MSDTLGLSKGGAQPRKILLGLLILIVIGALVYFHKDMFKPAVNVAIAPQEAVKAGAQWRVVGQWREPGASMKASSGETMQIEFKTLPGWKTPDSIDLDKIGQAGVNATYTEVNYPKQVILRLSGSNTIGAKLGPELAEAFLKENGAKLIRTIPGSSAEEVAYEGIYPDKELIRRIEIKAHGSATAFKDLKDGKCDIGMASRKVKDDEVQTLSFLGDMSSATNEHVLGLDGIAVIVNKDNPLKEMDKKQIAAIFSGQITDWSALGLPAARINVYARDNNSGTFDTFKHLVLDAAKVSLTSNATRFQSNEKLSDSVAMDKNGIGFCGLPYVNNSKELSVSEDGSAPIKPSIFTVGTEDYPLTRRLFLYTPQASKNKYVREFIEFALSGPGQEYVKKFGFVDLGVKTKNQVAQNEAKEGQEAPAAKPVNADVFRKYTQAVDSAQRLSLNFRFYSGSFSLDNRGRRDLDRIQEFLQDNKDKKIVLVGFSDDQGQYGHNLDLSVRRAQAVAAELKNRGVEVSEILGAGPEAPVASNASADGREKNRRVEVWVK